ncbi:MAG: L-threonylcarbamoyladenylate synthase [Algoriphagus sp.]|uniref:L-threonylcarbamoyladenylate synthase n=1 Tax=Algoriphagus sp. TaxID=1872435 RepID=UPI0026206925|nr:L-threonylcarbamoyladenylate synthase [Algoriphagus sp.]MDG1276947.1 L-threonylcarbamoyladenylate synthase [Algoriphagus sp.]
MAEISKDLRLAKRLLEEAKLVAIPTETVYGLAGNALNPMAVAAIFETKKRPSFDPLIIHVSELSKVATYVTDFPSPLRKLAEEFWPGPLTLLLPKSSKIPDLVTSGLDRVAIRVPNHPLTLQLLTSLDFPLAAPSANPFGYISPTLPAHVDAQLGDKIPLILDGGPCEVGLESTIIGLEGDEITVYRLGGLEIDAIEAVVGKVSIKDYSSSNPQAPGLLESHYAPSTSFVLGNLEELIPLYIQRGIPFAVLSFSKKWQSISNFKQLALSEKGDLKGAAANLFSHMRKLDELKVEVILAELMPNIGLGKAINDRLNRASAKR